MCGEGVGDAVDGGAVDSDDVSVSAVSARVRARTSSKRMRVNSRSSRASRRVRSGADVGGERDEEERRMVGRKKR